MLHIVTDMVYNFHNALVACPKGYKKGWDLMIATVDDFKDPTHYMNNVIFNFGHIFDNLRDFYMWLVYGSPGEDNNPYNQGYALGNVVYWIFFKTDSKRRPA
jgi:hypothetical protein